MGSSSIPHTSVNCSGDALTLDERFDSVTTDMGEYACVVFAIMFDQEWRATHHASRVRSVVLTHCGVVVPMIDSVSEKMVVVVREEALKWTSR